MEKSFSIMQQTWRVHVRTDGVLAKCESPAIGLSFSKSDFNFDSRIKAAARAPALLQIHLAGFSIAHLGS